MGASRLWFREVVWQRGCPAQHNIADAQRQGLRRISQKALPVRRDVRAVRLGCPVLGTKPQIAESIAICNYWPKLGQNET